MVAVSLKNCTTNIGQKHLLDSSLPAEERNRRAIEEMKDTLRPELLNRFNGRENIVCFQQLELDSMEKIIAREVGRINKSSARQGLAIDMGGDAIAAFARDRYDPIAGARGLPGYMNAHLEPFFADHALNTGEKGVSNVQYDEEKKMFVFGPLHPAAPAPGGSKPILVPA